MKPGRFPKPLRPGDLIRVVSPAGPVENSALSKGVNILKEWGYQVELGVHVCDRSKYFAGGDEQRLEDLVDALLDDKVKGIFASRGGYGSMRLLSDVPWEDISATDPKTFVGFSDIGAFQNSLLQFSGWGSFSGPQVAHGLGGGLNEISIRHLRNLIEGTMESFLWGEQDIILSPTSSSDRADGILIPLCLSVLVALMGTPYQADLRDCIVCIEDVEEPPYKLDRMFWQLRAAGVFDEVAALVLGKFTWEKEDISEEVLSIVMDLFSDFSIPIWAGLPYGHINEHITIPMGAVSSIDENGRLSLTDIQRT